MMKSGFALLGGSVSPRTQWSSVQASLGTELRIAKIGIILDLSRRIISEIKLKRTDTTLDLSQKAKRAKEERGKKGKGPEVAGLK